MVEPSGAGMRASLHILSPERCYELMSTRTIGRVCFAGSAGLQALPVNFRMFERTILIRTAVGGTLSELTHHDGEVLFEVDYHADVFREGWSVVIRGTATGASDPEVLASPELAHVMPWAPAERHVVVQIIPRQITGRAVVPHPS